MGRIAGYRLFIGIAATLMAALLTPAVGSAHVERGSYWPDPAPDCSISPCAGGAVPTPRTLASALNATTTRVVCQPDSVKRAQAAVDAARANGYYLRPLGGRQTLGPEGARNLMDLNRKLAKRCQFSSIQAAVNASSNNGRVVIMPGIYTEPESRAAPTYDQRCSQYAITNDRGDTGALSYKWQYYCPNDQNLIAVLGRAPGATDPPNPPREDRHGIPDLGPCIRCNLQI
jgi:hypothetical protein